MTNLKMTIYNVSSIQNSHVPTIFIIQRNSDVIKNVPLWKNKWRNCDLIKLCHNDKRKRNVAVTLIQYAMQTYHKNVTQKWGTSTQSKCSVRS